MKYLISFLFVFVLGCSDPVINSVYINDVHEPLYKNDDSEYYLRSRTVRLDNCLNCHTNIKRLDKGDYFGKFSYKILVKK